MDLGVWVLESLISSWLELIGSLCAVAGVLVAIISLRGLVVLETDAEFLLEPGFIILILKNERRIRWTIGTN